MGDTEKPAAGLFVRRAEHPRNRIDEMMFTWVAASLTRARQSMMANNGTTAASLRGL
jgi:hypothetical protein